MMRNQFFVHAVLETVYATVVTASTQEQAVTLFRSRFERNEIRGRRVGLRDITPRQLNETTHYGEQPKESPV